VCADTTACLPCGYFCQRRLRVSSPLELPVEPQIVLVEEAKVLDVVLEQRHALDAESPRVAREAIGVDAPVAQDLRVDHAASACLQPALPAAAAASLPHAATAHRVELVARLGVAEVMRPHAHAALATEERLDHVQQRAFQVADREAFVDG